MNFPEELFYHPEHTWARIEGDAATVGITDHAQRQLGEVVYVELPKKGRALSFGEVFGYVESSKSVSDLYSPAAGEVIETNSTLEDRPEAVNDDPYGEGWMIRIRLKPGFDSSSLMSSAGYEKRLEETRE